MSATRRELTQYLVTLAARYEQLQAERTFLMTGVVARLDVVNAERQELVAEAQLQLDRLNTLLTAAGEPTMSLAQVRALASPPARVPRGTP